MASITIRRLDDAVKSKLQIRAASHGRSMEEEAREILKAALQRHRMPRTNLADAIRQKIKPLGGVELTLAVREPVPLPSKFNK